MFMDGHNAPFKAFIIVFKDFFSNHRFFSLTTCKAYTFPHLFMHFYISFIKNFIPVSNSELYGSFKNIQCFLEVLILEGRKYQEMDLKKKLIKKLSSVPSARWLPK